MKRITLIILAITAIVFGSVSCQKDNIKPVEPIVPQGEGARWIRVMRSRTKKTMGGAEVSEANGVPTKVAARQPGAGTKK